MKLKLIILSILMLVALSGCRRIDGGDLKAAVSNEEIQTGAILNNDSVYCQEVQRIANETCGANLYLQRKMLLANIANN